MWILLRPSEPGADLISVASFNEYVVVWFTGKLPIFTESLTSLEARNAL